MLTRNLRLKALAMSLALVTWVAVVYSGNPPETRTVTVAVPQDANEIPAKYVLVDPIAAVSIRVNGTRDHLTNFAVSSLDVTVNFAAIKAPGRNSIPLKIINHDPDVDLDPGNPTAVVANVDTLTSASKAVQVIFNPPPPRGYIVLRGAASPASVDVTGPNRQVEAVIATVTLDLSQQKTNVAEQTAIVLQVGGHRVTDIGVSPPTVQISATVEQSSTSRGSAVVPRTTGFVAAGHQLGGISVTPTTVLLTGAQDLLNSLDALPTTTIDLTGLTIDRTVTVRLVTPAGVTVVPDTVTIHISVTSLSTPIPTATPTPTPAPIPTPSP